MRPSSGSQRRPEARSASKAKATSGKECLQAPPAGVHHDLAFQCSLLALSAAVTEATSGEAEWQAAAGEVRNLADRAGRSGAATDREKRLSGETAVDAEKIPVRKALPPDGHRW